MAEDRLSKNEAFADLSAGLGGAILGAILSPMMARQAGVSVTQQIGKSLVANHEKITGPILSRLSKKDEQMFAGVELKLVGEHGGVPFKDILTKLLAAMGPWASDRFRSIDIGIPLPTPKKSNEKVTKRDGTIEETATEETATEESTGETNPRVLFLTETVKDVIRFGKPGTDQTPPNFDAGIDQVLKNLKIRNIADADSMTAKISRWWDDPHFEEYTQITWDKLILLYGWALPKVLKVNSIKQVTPELVAARFKEFFGPVPDVTLPRPNDNAGWILRALRTVTPGSFPNVKAERPKNRRVFGIILIVLVACFYWAIATVVVRAIHAPTIRIINEYKPPAETPADAPVK